MARIFKFGDGISTDAIIPGRYNVTTDATALGKACFIEARPDFAASVQPGDVIVGGRNFGCGSSREHAPMAIKAAGIQAVVARSFARIFYRNAINLGLPALVCAQAKRIRPRDDIAVDLDAARIDNRTTGETLAAEPLPAFLRQIVRDGGLLAHLERRLRGERASA